MFLKEPDLKDKVQLLPQNMPSLSLHPSLPSAPPPPGPGRAHPPHPPRSHPKAEQLYTRVWAAGTGPPTTRTPRWGGGAAWPLAWRMGPEGKTQRGPGGGDPHVPHTHLIIHPQPSPVRKAVRAPRTPETLHLVFVEMRLWVPGRAGISAPAPRGDAGDRGGQESTAHLQRPARSCRRHPPHRR